jgi:uncharacterized protein YjbJ (UPF0337 family)
LRIPRTVAHMTEAVKGSANSMAGRITGSRRLRSSQATGNIKQAGAKIEDASGH